MTGGKFSVSIKYRTLFFFCDGIPWPLNTEALCETLNFSDLIKFQHIIFVLIYAKVLLGSGGFDSLSA